MEQVICPECGCPFDYLLNILGDYTELEGSEHDGCILSGCPMCGEEVEVPQ